MTSRVRGLVVLMGLVAAACGGAAQEGPDRSLEAPARTLNGTDLTRHSVPLEDIHFDTFRGSSIPLTKISEQQARELLDAIPPLTDPRYDSAGGGDWLEEEDPVVGYVAGGEAYAYPFKILNFHEIVNDELGGTPVLVTYCPLCRSGIVYDRRLDGRILSFGNTSALYQSDLVMIDRETRSYWWQVSGEAIVGDLTGARLPVLPSVTMPWGEWRRLHPDTMVLSRETGHQRPYERDLFAGYEDAVNAGRFPFPVTEEVMDERLAPAEQVLGVVLGSESRAYPVGRLGDAAVNDTVGGEPVVVFSSKDGPSGAAFSPVVDGRHLTFGFEGGAYRDGETGSEWAISGQAVGGPLAGTRLEPVPSRSTFWFAYVAAFPETEVYTG